MKQTIGVTDIEQREPLLPDVNHGFIESHDIFFTLLLSIGLCALCHSYTNGGVKCSENILSLVNSSNETPLRFSYCHSNLKVRSVLGSSESS